MAAPARACMDDRSFVPVLRPRLPDAERLLPYLRRIDAARVYTNWGPLTIEFEDRLAAHFGLPPGTVTTACSGTAALIGAILATAGRATSARPYAIVPAFTFVATALAVEQCGYQPVIADVDASSWTLALDRLQNHPLLSQTGLVVVAAPFGRAVSQAACLEFREQAGVPVVIDGAGCFEALERNPRVIGGGVPVALSFHATKSFSTGEGGCVITSDTAIAVEIWRALNFGFRSTRDSTVASTNGKMSEYHAAVGLAELDGWPAKRAALQDVAQRYRRAFASEHRAEPLWVAPDVAGCYALLEVENDAASTRARERLADAAIDSRLWYGTGLHEQTHFRECPHDALTVTSGLASRIIGLPTAPDLADSAIARIVRALGDAA
jgi:dTDP-4-amino-4,6-dideoxygalactose transaminase